MNLQETAITVAKIAIEAGRLIMTIYDDQENIALDWKADQSPLTNADLTAHRLIVRQLEAAFDWPVVSEENVEEWPADRRAPEDMLWLVDPLDGTKEFIKRNGEFTVNIALVKAGAPVLGIIHIPAKGETYFGGPEIGSYQYLDSGLVKLEVKSYQYQEEGLPVMVSRSFLDDRTKAFCDSLVSPNTISAGSALKFIEIAKGNAAVYPRFGRTMEWDSAAGHAVLLGAGGNVFRITDQQALDYNKTELYNPDFFAIASATFPDELYALVLPVVKYS